jgi:hypothetical protein
MVGNGCPLSSYEAFEKALGAAAEPLECGTPRTDAQGLGAHEEAGGASTLAPQPAGAERPNEPSRSDLTIDHSIVRRESMEMKASRADLAQPPPGWMYLPSIIRILGWLSFVGGLCSPLFVTGSRITYAGYRVVHYSDYLPWMAGGVSAMVLLYALAALVQNSAEVVIELRHRRAKRDETRAISDSGANSWNRTERVRDPGRGETTTHQDDGAKVKIDVVSEAEQRRTASCE